MSVTAMPVTPTAEAEAEAPPKGGKKKKIVILLVVLAVAAGAWFFVLKPAPAGPPQPGTVLPLDSIQINLSGAHYLRIGIALQLVKGVKEADGSKALDATIEEFSGQSMASLDKPGQRETLKAALVKKLDKAYEGDVMGVYFTEFVTQ